MDGNVYDHAKSVNPRGPSADQYRIRQRRTDAIATVAAKIS
jgi:hypothetical protein